MKNVRRAAHRSHRLTQMKEPGLFLSVSICVICGQTPLLFFPVGKAFFGEVMPIATKYNELLDPELMNRLERLDIVSRKIFAGRMKGERRSKRKGQSVEFADYRNYVVGDDLRFLDWNIYARLEKLFIKLFFEEEDLYVSVLLDTSKSMNWGEPNKGLYTRRVAAALAYIGLINFDRVSLYTYANGLQYELAGIRGRRWMHKVIEFLGEIEYDG